MDNIVTNNKVVDGASRLEGLKTKQRKSGWVRKVPTTGDTLGEEPLNSLNFVDQSADPRRPDNIAVFKQWSYIRNIGFEQ
jgi:hypothetical protein